MPQIPNIQPADLFSMYSGVGKSIATATEGVGDAIDAYNTVERLKTNEAARKQARQAILTKYKFDEDAIPANIPMTELGRLAHHLQTMETTILEAKKVGVPYAPSLDVGYKAALDSEENYNYGLRKLQDAIQATAKDKEDQANKDLEQENQLAKDQALATAGSATPMGQEAPSVARGITNVTYKKKTRTGEMVDVAPTLKDIGQAADIYGSKPPTEKYSGNSGARADAKMEFEKFKEANTHYQKMEDKKLKLINQKDQLARDIPIRKQALAGGEFAPGAERERAEKELAEWENSMKRLPQDIASAQHDYELAGKEVRQYPEGRKRYGEKTFTETPPAVGGGAVAPSSRSDVSGAAIPSATIELAKKAIAPGSGATPAQIEQAKRILAAAGIH